MENMEIMKLTPDKKVTAFDITALVLIVSDITELTAVMNT